MGGLRMGGAVRAVVLRGVLGAVVRLPGAFWELQSSAKDMLGAVVLRGCGAEPHPPVSPVVFGAIPVSAPRRPFVHSSVCHLRLSHTAPSRPPRPPPWDGMGWGQLSGRGVNVGRVGHGVRLTAASAPGARKQSRNLWSAVGLCSLGTTRGRAQGSAEPGQRRGYGVTRGVCGVR